MAAGAMDDLADRFADRGVTSVFLYTREAHPGEHYPHHTSMEVKRHHAAAFRDVCSVRRRILLDDLEGTLHLAYGMLPNTSWIIGRGGLIAYKADWTAPDDVADALEAFLTAVGRRGRDGIVPMRTERIGWRHRDQDAFRAGLERAGPQAVRDFYGT